MARLSEDQWEDVFADWHTGRYSKNELSKKYNVSHTAVNKKLKGVEPKHKDKVSELTRIKTELAEESCKEVSAVEREVEEATKHLQFIKNATLKNLSSMTRKIDTFETAKDHKDAQDAIDKGAVTLGVAQRHASTPQVAIQNNQQTNQPIQIVIEGEGESDS